MKRAGLLGVLLLVLALPGWAQANPDFTGLWRPIGLGRQILTLNGQAPPLIGWIS